MYDRKGDGKLYNLIGFKNKSLLAMLSSSSLNEFCYSNRNDIATWQLRLGVWGWKFCKFCVVSVQQSM